MGSEGAKDRLGNDLAPDGTLDSEREGDGPRAEGQRDSEGAKLRCEVCGFTPLEKHASKLLHRHHIHPKGVGGVKMRNNTMVLCSGCHHLVHVLIDDGTIMINLIKRKYTYGETLQKVRCYRESAMRRGRKCFFGKGSRTKDYTK